MTFQDLFGKKHPLIAVLHLLPLPGSPRWSGDPDAVYKTAMNEAKHYEQGGADAILIENFGDAPFFPDHVPAVTVAAMAGIARQVVNQVSVPVGINVLRNDASSALAIAVASGASFIRVNVHTGAMVTDQGLIQGKAFETLRARASLKSEVLIFADVHVKHAVPLASRSIADETHDLVERGLVDAVIVSGSGTGTEINPLDLKVVREASRVPVLTGSGVSAGNLKAYFPLADGFIVGSDLKSGGKAANPVDSDRVKAFTEALNSLKNGQ